MLKHAPRRRENEKNEEFQRKGFLFKQGLPNSKSFEHFIFGEPRFSEKPNGSGRQLWKTINKWLNDSFMNYPCLVLKMKTINHFHRNMPGNRKGSWERQGGSGMPRSRCFRHQKSDMFQMRVSLGLCLGNLPWFCSIKCEPLFRVRGIFRTFGAEGIESWIPPLFP